MRRAQEQPLRLAAGPNTQENRASSSEASAVAKLLPPASLAALFDGNLVGVRAAECVELLTDPLVFRQLDARSPVDGPTSATHPSKQAKVAASHAPSTCGNFISSRNLPLDGKPETCLAPMWNRLDRSRVVRTRLGTWARGERLREFARY